MKRAVDIAYATKRPWAPPAVRLARWVGIALGRRRGRVALKVVTSAESRRLNRTWRGRDRATNVLSFPAEPLPKAGDGPPLLGDLALCASIVAREAREQGKSPSAHWAHMVVHGTLHLLGYDHVSAKDAERMERRERVLLARLGFPDPYESPP